MFLIEIYKENSLRTITIVCAEKFSDVKENFMIICNMKSWKLISLI